MLADYHNHCKPWSPDAEDTMLAMARAAYKKGITHLCITNHIENCAQTPMFSDQFPPFHDYEGLKREFDRVRAKMPPELDMRLGCEIGSPHYVPEEGRKIYSSPIFDFAIGSVHNLRGKRDFYYLVYPDDFEKFRPEVEEYLDENIALAASGLCDVIGHLGYMRRYMARQNKGFDMMTFEDRLRELFKVCVDRGVGIELNASGLTDALHGFIPEPEVLKLYRELGGEIITCGTDAHETGKIGVGIREAYELLRSLGYKYVCLYKNHKPEFIRL